jgi:hypothetical protein
VTGRGHLPFAGVREGSDREPELAAFDVVAWRADGGPAAARPPLSLSDALRGLQGLQRMLASLAEVVDQRHAGVPGRRHGSARPFLRAVLVGPTDLAAAGSVSALVPVDPPEADGLVPRPEGPFARQVTVALAQAVRAAHDAAALVAGGDDAARAFGLSADLGVTAAVCKTLATLAGGGERPSAFELSVTWSAARAGPGGEGGPVRFTPDLLGALRRGARELDRPDVLHDVVLRGRVMDLRRDPEGAEGVVLVRGHFTSDPLQRPRQADVRLPLPAYQRALRAHGEARLVEARGTLELRRSRWLLRAAALTLVD